MSKSARGQGRVKGLGGRQLSPPAFEATIGTSHRFRFTCAAGNGGAVVTRKNLLNLLQLATSAVTTVRLLQAVRLRSVEVWTNPVALGSAPTTCSIEWVGENAPSVVESDISLGVRPAHVRSSPPQLSSSQWWSISGQQETDQLFILSLPANSIVDVIADIRFVESEAPTAGDIPAGASLGQLYGNYLDGIAGSTLTPFPNYVAIP